MALPEIGHTTSIGGERYELVSIYKLQDGQVTLQFERVANPPDVAISPEVLDASEPPKPPASLVRKLAKAKGTGS